MTREEAIKGLTSLVEVRREYCDMQTMKDEIECLDMAIKALKQDEKWTSVSESQPEEDGEYFVTWITSRVNRPLLEICEYSCGMWDIDNGSAYSDAQVVAWMPLPKPYQESEEV